MQALTERIYEMLETPQRADALARQLPGTPRREITKALEKLAQEGRILRNKKNKYGRPEAFGCITATFLATERRYNFAAPGDGGADIFIPPGQDGDAWQGDRVLIRLEPSPRKKSGQENRREGAVIKILAYSREDIVGVVQKKGKAFFLLPSSAKYPRIELMRNRLEGAQAGDQAAVKVVFRGDSRKHLPPQGAVTAVLGKGGTMEASIAAILHENGITERFPPDVLEQAGRIPPSVDVYETLGRIDLRTLLLFTMDGDDAKDFDDAVSLEPLEGGRVRLGVHIADVSHYVTPDSPLDREAFRRGTSVYYPGHVVPMLPLSLSAGICSLVEGEDRLAFSAFLDMEPDGRLVHADFARTLIRSHARLTYRKANAILAGDEALRQEYAALVPALEGLGKLARALRARRLQRGALDLDIPEAAIILDENGRTAGVQARERGEAERLIEECMLAANEAVAAHMHLRSVPTVYRVHDKPDPEKLRAFAALAKPFGYRVNAGKPEDTAQLQAVLDGAKGNPEQQVLPTMLLRSLARARYDDNCSGHYGLKAKYYLHFTSPIRRYPDLVAHRMLYKELTNQTVSNADYSLCEEAALQSTTREQAADSAERDIDKLYMADYMRQFIGQEFEGIVTGVTGFGLFVALPNLVEGLVRLETLSGDFFAFDSESMTLRGTRTGKRYAIGTPLRVIVAAASNVTGQIDFVPADGQKPTTGE